MFRLPGGISSLLQLLRRVNTHVVDGICEEKGNMSEIVKCLGSDLKNTPQPDVLLVVASQLLYHIL